MIIKPHITPFNRTIKKIAEELTTIAPKAQASKPKMTIKSKVLQSIFEEGAGTNIISEQNKALITSRHRTTGSHPITRTAKGYISPYLADFERLCGPEDITLEKALELQQKFFDETGLILHVPSNKTSTFSNALQSICCAVHEGTFPKDIKHVLIGHGYGSSQAKAWTLEGTGLKDGKIIEIFPYINKNVPNGEKVLVCSCEHSLTKVANKPGIGDEVELSLACANFPGKVVRSGIDRIIGHYTVTDGYVPYEMYIKPKT